MSYRGGPRTLDERVADIEEQLRGTQTSIATAVSVTDHGGLAGLGDDDHGQYQLRSEQGEPDGYPSLDGDGEVPKAELPDDVVYAEDIAALDDAEMLAWLALGMAS